MFNLLKIVSRVVILLVFMLSFSSLVKADDDILINPTLFELVDDNLDPLGPKKRCECLCYKFTPPFAYELIASADSVVKDVAVDKECSTLEPELNSPDLIFGTSLASRACKGVLLTDMNEYLEAIDEGILYDPRDLPHVDGGIFKCAEPPTPPNNNSNP